MNNSQKSSLAIAIAAGIILSLSACGNESATTTDNKDSLPKDTIAQVPAADTTSVKQPFTVSGTIGEITSGKDGYMAELKGADSTKYSTVFSIMKLEKNYKRLNTGDKVEVSGDTFHLGNVVHIQVKQFSVK